MALVNQAVNAIYDGATRPCEPDLKTGYASKWPRGSAAPNKSVIISIQQIPTSKNVKPKGRRSVRASKQAIAAVDTSAKSHSPNNHVQIDAAPKTETPCPATTARCPAMTPEFQSIQERYKNLASTGCTAQFCQAGRMLHSDEPRVGENRALEIVEAEARDFLEELHHEGFFGSDKAFCERLRAATKEIRSGTINGHIRQDKKQGRVGGNWTQTPAELEFGLRRAWRNSRKCIMRSHCEELKLCDFRSITSSTAMATELIKGVSDAFNSGNIQPTVFVFPPRNPNSRGPMIWNNQILAFAGYELEDGSVLGDPSSRELTKAIIELGWTPPQPRSRWDLLPMVTMADEDVPVIAELPPDLRKVVEIRHPQYGREFEELDLKWVAFPALSRLGFDVGGVQYTATPFIGWFMDAEIGVRNLADTFRYNVLPDVVQVLGLTDGKMGEIAESFEDLPEYERLAMLSRAQSELNYAVHWSFSQAQVNMTDSLTASVKWSRYDDEFKEKNGFRLPADPYWLAPPQGSIIPVWHRGGAPNYQPKPMICKHVQDPVKAWTREKPDWFISAKELNFSANLRQKRPKTLWRSATCDSRCKPSQKIPLHGVPRLVDEEVSDVVVQELEVLPQTTNMSIEIYYCSVGILAEKIAAKLYDRTASLIKDFRGAALAPEIQALNNLQGSSLTQEKVLLLVVSSTGKGEIPANGSKIVEICQDLVSRKQDSTHFRYAIYGNGDTRYSGTYNGAAKIIQQQLRRVGGRPIAGGLFDGDTAIQSTAFQALSPWWTKLRPALQDLVVSTPKLVRTHSQEVERDHSLSFDDTSREDLVTRVAAQSQQLHDHFQSGNLVSVNHQVRPGYPGSYLVTIDIGDRTYEDLGCIQILPLNSPSKVRGVLRALGVSGSVPVELDSNLERCPSYSRFLSELVDLEAPFSTMDWLDHLDLTSGEKMLETEVLSSQSVLEVLQSLETSGLLADIISTMRLDVCLSMPLLHTRNYSIASSQPYISQSPDALRPVTTRTKSPSNLLQIVVKPHSNGRFSSTFLTDCPTPAKLKYRIVDSICGPSLRQPTISPMIVVATGAGSAPVRCLLQRRITAARQGQTTPDQCGISLFLGLKPADISLVATLLMEAAAMGVLDSLRIVPSNEAKMRVYERLEEDGVREVVRRKLLDEGGRVFVCSGQEAATGTREAIRRVMGVEVERVMGKRWIEEVF